MQIIGETKGAPLLRVEDLHVSYNTPTGLVRAVSGVSFELGREKLGIVGESGSGKSQTGRAILGLTAGAEVRANRLEFEGIDLLNASQRTMRQLRGKCISMIMQDPKFSLNPVMRVGAQIAEAYLLHANTSKAQARTKSIEMLEAVSIRDPERVYNMYPHEVSGGMGQRIMIAMMMIPDPKILIADEPTGNLDPDLSLEVMRIFRRFNEVGVTLLIASHDIALIDKLGCRRIELDGGQLAQAAEEPDPWE